MERTWQVFRSPAPTAPGRRWVVRAPSGVVRRFGTWAEAWRYTAIQLRAHTS